MKATAKDLRFQTNDLLNAVKRGEEVLISYHGKPCAKLVPLDETDEKKSTDELFGMWTDNDEIESIDKYVRNLRKERNHVN